MLWSFSPSFLCYSFLCSLAFLFLLWVFPLGKSVKCIFQELDHKCHIHEKPDNKNDFSHLFSAFALKDILSCFLFVCCYVQYACRKTTYASGKGVKIKHMGVRKLFSNPTCSGNMSWEFLLPLMHCLSICREHQTSYWQDINQAGESYQSREQEWQIRRSDSGKALHLTSLLHMSSKEQLTQIEIVSSFTIK